MKMKKEGPDPLDAMNGTYYPMNRQLSVVVWHGHCYLHGTTQRNAKLPRAHLPELRGAFLSHLELS